MTMITPSYLGETIEYSSLHACRSTLEDPTADFPDARKAVKLQGIKRVAGRDRTSGHTPCFAKPRRLRACRAPCRPNDLEPLGLA